VVENTFQYVAYMKTLDGLYKIRSTIFLPDETLDLASNNLW